ncbi:MFS transporter [Ornithinimicrobium faecis]|uniref:MFS transporter n=1 Tax=Ornithinimicrobium faecis TaxID=2934158 RepID=UPI002118CD54|nr:MFS transporter [Ornithinimicrobium sp. HY1745]
MSALRIFTPLRSPGLRRLWPGQVAALFAAEIHLVVIAWLALELTGSGFALGAVLGVGLLPRIVFTLVGGVAADRLGHRRILVWCNAIRAVIVGALALATVLEMVQVWHLYVVALLLGSISSFYAPAIYSSVPRECPPEDLRAGNALMRGTAEAAGVIGPVAGGALVALVGTGWAMWGTAGLYAVACLTMALLLRAGGWVRPGVPVGAPVAGEATGSTPRRRQLVHDLRDGFATVRNDGFLVRVLILLAVAAVALSGPITVGIPWLAREEFGVSASAFGVLLAMWTAGSLLGVLAAGSSERLPSWRTLMTVLTVVMTVSLATLGLVRELPVAAVCLLLMGAAAGAFNIVLVTWLQERTSPERLGRMMSLAELAELVASPASYLAAGLMLDISVLAMFLGASAVFLVGASVVLLAGQPQKQPQPHPAERH